MNFLISQELANKILVYLTKQPYQDVADIIQQLQKLQTVNIVSPDDKPKEETKIEKQ